MVNAEEKIEYFVVSVADRSEEIFNIWKGQSLSSKKIVKEVDAAIARKNAKLTPRNQIEAYAYLCALDRRVSERYDSFWRSILHYFAWKRETQALNRLRFELKLPKGKSLREAIELEAERMSALELDELVDELNSSGKKKGKDNAEAEKGEEALDSDEAKGEELDAKKDDLTAEKDAEAQEEATTDAEKKFDTEATLVTDEALSATQGADAESQVAESVESYTEEIKAESVETGEMLEGEALSSEDRAQKQNDYTPDPSLERVAPEEKTSAKDLRFLDDELIGYRETPEELFGDAVPEREATKVETNAQISAQNSEQTQANAKDMGFLYDKGALSANLARDVGTSSPNTMANTERERAAQRINKPESVQKEADLKQDASDSRLEISEQEENELRRSISEALAAEPEFVARYVEASVDAVNVNQMAIQNEKMQISVIEAKAEAAPIEAEREANAGALAAAQEIKK